MGKFVPVLHLLLLLPFISWSFWKIVGKTTLSVKKLWVISFITYTKKTLTKYSQIYCKNSENIWAPSSEFVSSSIPSWQISTAHAQPFSWARDLAFCLKVPLDSLLVWASSEGSGETARMRRLAWTFAARIGDKYQIRLTRSIRCCKILCNSNNSCDRGTYCGRLVP